MSCARSHLNRDWWILEYSKRAIIADIIVFIERLKMSFKKIHIQFWKSASVCISHVSRDTKKRYSTNLETFSLLPWVLPKKLISISIVKIETTCSSISAGSEWNKLNYFGCYYSNLRLRKPNKLINLGFQILHWQKNRLKLKTYFTDLRRYFWNNSSL